MEKNMENEMEAIWKLGNIVYIGVILLGLFRDNGKEAGNYRDYMVYVGVKLTIGPAASACHKGNVEGLYRGYTGL